MSPHRTRCSSFSWKPLKNPKYKQRCGNSFQYDANGNLTSDGTNSFVYDVENRLVAASVRTTTGSVNEPTLLYDPLGRLHNVSEAGGGQRNFYDGDELVATYNTSNQVHRRFVHGAGQEMPLAAYSGDTLGLAARRYLMPDERGSNVGEINADGSSRGITRYDEHGYPDPYG